MAIKDKYYIIPLLLLFFLAAWAFWAFVYPAHLHLAEQLQMFEFTSQYFLDTIVKPAGLAEYISRFLTQFFYSDTLGPVVVACVLTLIYHAATLLCRQTSFSSKLSSLSSKLSTLTPPPSSLSSHLSALISHPSSLSSHLSSLSSKLSTLILPLVPALLAWAFLVSMDAKLTMPIALCLCIYSVVITLKATRSSSLLAIHYLVITLVSFLLAFFVGSAFVVYTSLSIIALCCRIKQNHDNGYSNRILFTLIFGFALCGSVVAVISYVYPYPRDVLTWGSYYNRFVFIPAEYNVSTWLFTIASLAFILIVSTVKHSKTATILTSAVSLIAAITCGILLSQRVNTDEESMLDNMYLMHQERWDDIISKHSSLSSHPSSLSSNLSSLSSHLSALTPHPPQTSYEQAPLNLALAMRDQLADRYFSIRQFGIDGLLPRYQMDYMTPLLSADAYFHMGMVNTAQRFYYESMESIADHQKSSFLLQRLTLTAIANGRYALAKRYIHKLKHTLYYAQWAHDIERYADNPSLISQHPLLKRLSTLRTKQVSLFNDDNPPAYIAEMLNSNPANPVAWQYLFTSLMVEGRLDELMQTAQFYTSHFPERMLPAHVQEALMYTWVMKTGAINGFPWRVSNEIGQRFMQFAQSANQPREVAEPIVRRDFADTFWCYAVFKAQQSAPSSSPTNPDARTGASPQTSKRE